MPEKSDIELIEGYISGEAEFLDVLIKRYLPMVYNFVLRLSGRSADAPDIVQDIFVKVWRKIESFDREKNFKTWLFTIAHRTVIDWFRKKKEKIFSALSGEEDLPFEDSLIDAEPLPDEIFSRAEERESLRRLISRLPEKYQTVVYLKYDEELTFEEISQVLEVPLNTVKSQYRRALLLLKDMLRNAPKPSSGA